MSEEAPGVSVDFANAYIAKLTEEWLEECRKRVLLATQVGVLQTQLQTMSDSATRAGEDHARDRNGLLEKVGDLARERDEYKRQAAEAIAEMGAMRESLKIEIVQPPSDDELAKTIVGRPPKKKPRAKTATVPADSDMLDGGQF